MSSSQPSATKFWIVATIAVAGTSCLLAQLWPQVPVSLQRASKSFLTTSAQTSPQNLVDDQLAVLLNPASPTANRALAYQQIGQNQNQEAIHTLVYAGQGIGETRLETEALLNLGRMPKAAQTAAALARSATTSNLQLAALAYDAAGDTQTAQTLIGRIASPQAAQAILYATSGKLPLAYELLVTGLPDASQRVLSYQPNSYARSLMLARINLQLDQNAPARSYASLAVAQMPSSIDARNILAQADQALGQTQAASIQRLRVVSLSTGKP